MEDNDETYIRMGNDDGICGESVRGRRSLLALA